MAHKTRFAGSASLIAAISMAFTPAQAHAAETAPIATMGYATNVLSNAPGTAFDSSRYDVDADTAEWRGRGFGWGRGWRGRGWRGHRRGVRGGDILAGVLVLGGIAAIASAANNNNRRNRDVVVVERDRVRDDDRRYDYRPENRNTTRSTNSGSGIDNAVSMCLNEIERDVRVDSVDGASRNASGWVVTGSIFNGSGFVCEIDNSGRINNINYGGFSNFEGSDGSRSASAGQRAEGQLSDDAYADARAQVGYQNYSEGETTREFAYNDVPVADGPLPAYPGGPLPGEE